MTVTVSLVADEQRIYLSEDMPAVPSVGDLVDLDDGRFVVTDFIYGYGLDPSTGARVWSPSVQLTPRDI